MFRKTLLYLSLFLYIGVGYAQISDSKDVLLLTGEIPFWQSDVEGTVSFGDLAGSTIDSTGKFSFLVPSIEENLLQDTTDYDGINNCLRTSNPNSQYAHYFFLDLALQFRSNATIDTAEFYLQTPSFDFQIGDAIQEWHYYSEATTISGRCVVEYDDDSSATFLFDSLTMDKGWNELVTIISEVKEDSTTYIVNKSVVPLRWEIEAISFDLYGGYGGIGVFISKVEEGVLLDDVVQDGPADKAGLEAGDVITAIDSEDIKDMGYGALDLRIRGDVGSKAIFTVLRGEQVLEFEITRELLSQE